MDKQWRREKRNFYDAWQKGLVTGGGSGTWDGFVSAGEPAAMNGFLGYAEAHSAIVLGGAAAL